ncbi:SDR family NAD(P)-dependent oxidoreductase [Kitasatospora sp. NPDC052896]|uniref:SDR family NAD(P)-dependent oxidoreductase n=1 Tax=Kitasatospora sp. NPDC052896 TaxID=3364061 RepID=UPI0037C5B2FC
MSDLVGRSAVVTGGGSGIGLATVRALVERGARVTALDLDPSRVPAPARAVTADLRDEAAVRTAVDAAAAAQGGLDVLVNNAAVAGGAGGVEQHPLTLWRQVYEVNVLGMVCASRAALPHLRRSAHPAIVNLCSMVATTGLPDRAMYAASKGAVHALTLAMAADLVGEGIRVNAVSPGTTDTPAIAALAASAADPPAALDDLRARMPIRRLVAPEEVAAAIAFLVGPLAAAVTGTVLTVDGGLGSILPAASRPV